MLVDVKFEQNQMGMINMIIGHDYESSSFITGCYNSTGFSFEENIKSQLKDGWPEFETDGLNAGGVCDNPKQLLEKFTEIKDSKRKFCISFVNIVKSEQSSECGWRWHKWGDYVGDKKPQYEYLYDEDQDFKEVYVFHIYEIN